MRYIFITGAGRSGTNLINGILDGHSKLNVFPGEVTNILYQSLNNSGLSPNILLKNNEKIFINTFLNEIKIKNKNKIRKRIFQSLKNKKKIKIEKFFNIIFRNIYQTKKYNIVNIQNENITGLLDNFKNPKIIHLLRNPYTQLNSRYIFRHLQPKNYMGNEFSEGFKRNYISFQQANIYKNNKNVFLLKMEDLLKNREDKIKQICKFLNIKVEKKNYQLSRSNLKFKSTYKGEKYYGTKFKEINHDYSNLLPNDLYYCSKIRTAKNFYKIKTKRKVKNSYLLFLSRHLGFIGKNRKVPKNPIKILKLIIYSIFNYISDVKSKHEFDEFIRLRN